MIALSTLQTSIVALLAVAGAGSLLGILLSLAAAIEAGSSHPLAEAIVAEAQARKLAPAPAANVKALAGRGVSGTVAGAPTRTDAVSVAGGGGTAAPPVQTSMILS